MAKEQAQEPISSARVLEGDFRRIPGIGPGIEKRLHGAGITTYAQLAALTPAEITELLSGVVGLKPEMIERKDWIGQADRLAQELHDAQGDVEEEPPDETRLASRPAVEESGTGVGEWLLDDEPASSVAESGAEPAGAEPPGAELPGEETNEPEERQYYDSYMIELLLDEGQHVRRTRATHVKDGESEGWAGWDIHKLGEWISARAGLRAVSLARASEPTLREMGAQKKGLPLKGTLEVRAIRTTTPDEDQDARFFEDGCFTVQLDLDMRGLNVPDGTPLRYRSIVIARRLGSAERIEQERREGELRVADTITIATPVRDLPEGIYRLENMIMVLPAGDAASEQNGLQAMSEGKIVQVLSGAAAA